MHHQIEQGPIAQNLIEQLIRPEIRALKAYPVPDATGMIKLDAMENPYSWPEALCDDWLEALREAELNRYPDPRAPALQTALREAMRIPQDMDLLLGNGSDELIQMLALAVAAPAVAQGDQPGTRLGSSQPAKLGDSLRARSPRPSEPCRPTLLSLDPGFVMYRMIGLFAGLEYVGVNLNAADFSLDLAATLAAIERHQPRLTFIAYPNNPTGNLFDPAAIEQIIAASPGLVIVDEAYAPFTDASFLPRLGDWPNLLVMRTVSKMGLAGLRLGYLAGPAQWIEQIDKVRLPYNINVLSQASAAFALNHRHVLDAQTNAIRSERQRLANTLTTLDGGQGRLHPFPSDANFILVRTQPGRAGALFHGLRGRNILIKNLDGAHPILADCLRITVGTPDENSALLNALAELLDEG
ncbi:MAG: aminotransferase class I/II-fold pyridoxal phosphate-dependent enzyme [Lamprobacter sp.]|uniref:pyridoxal phosphate-dependent aminotransferase n=1 Tax=Lamprobacter sp. TaxID=3100796 RepID=UPI002B2627F7|nr:aminotransferase class I/II-fold pyridoxal phosphate-dependent enzyme [Lamprobacter sp.]MEA3638785.1 aminotransferase class I/II-fold pyridoxal phosphate-dependent enzyme [Lamprobacter sp.]